MSTVLKVENLSKQYRLGKVGTGTVSHDLNRWWAKVRGKEDPFLKVGDINDRSTKGESEYVWALRDISFEVEQGQAIGIIGRNGAGKSTLLKLLSRVTKPTTGTIHYKGRIASLLEVGTGFHPEMTGRENIYLNGAILGMTRKEITRKFDEIVDFAGVERYIDTPVKRYSSGMYVRLAFAVAAHLESEILIVDEVLAVGDAEFQKKCLGKMSDVTKGEGRTVLFVSHNMAMVQKLCTKGIYLDNGEIKYEGDIIDVIEGYIKINESLTKVIPNNNNKIYLSGFNYYDSHNKSLKIKSGGSAIFEFEITSQIEADNILIGLGVNNRMGNRIITPFSLHENVSYRIKKGKNVVFCEIPEFILKPNKYFCEIYIGTKDEVYDYYDKGLILDVETINNDTVKFLPGVTQGDVILNQKWSNILE